jgi:hypothetical protein
MLMMTRDHSKHRLVIFLLWLGLSVVNGGEDNSGPDCLTDTHIQCGELIVWNETRSPSSTILQLKFPERFDASAGWSVHLSTCHEVTTASTTIKVKRLSQDRES